MTLFVSPFWPMVGDVDISERLAEIAGRGHEIAQHTHYYSWDGIPRPDYRKRVDLSGENVRHCLGRDYTALCRAGSRPAGFTSGGWETHETIPEWLTSNGFAYDCTPRSYQPAVDGVVPVGPSPRSVPTTHSLRLALLDLRDARLAGCTLGSGGRRYALCYSHDYDLVRPGRLTAMKAVVLMGGRGSTCTTVGNMVETVAP